MRTNARLGILVGLVALGCHSGSGSPGNNATGTGGTSAGAGGVTGSGGTGAPGTGGSGPTGGGGTSAGGTTGAGGSPTGAGGSVTDGSAPDAPAPVPFTGTYHMGADITWVQHDEYYGATYVDTDGVTKDILALLKNHGFNSVRMRAYVNPLATDGYDLLTGGQGFGDTDHTIAMAQRIKAAGMGFYLALHYSDNWADPGKQCIPVAWQGAASVAALATFVHDYTFDFITRLKAVNAAPELVQVGNEITSGMLIHICDGFGLPLSTNAVNGRATAANWPNLGTLLKAGIRGVKEVDPNIKTVLHIERAGDANASVAFITNALTMQQVPFDVFANSAYVYWHGQPGVWQATFNRLATMFPTLSFLIPEYGNETATNPPLTSTLRYVNDLVINLPNNRGLGAWIYEPEHPYQAGPRDGVSLGIGLFDVARDGGVATGDSWPVVPAMPAAMSVYDEMKTVYANRLR